MAFFAAHDYARVLWWPQPHVERLTIWTADRVAPGTEAPQVYDAFPRVFGSRVPMQAAAGAALWTISAGLTRHEPRPQSLAARALGALYRGFVPRGEAQDFAGLWHHTLPLDDQIDERWMPVSFIEFWIARADASEALARLARVFADQGYGATNSFACELYPACASAAWLHPGHGRESLRINLFWLEGRPEVLRAEWFERIHAALADLDLRLHWGKYIGGQADRLEALAASYPRRAAFLELRERYDPEGLFYTPYWRRRLGLELEAGSETPQPTQQTSASPRRAPPLLVHPLVLHLDPADEALLVEAEEHLHASAVVPAAADVVDRNYTHLVDARAWLPQFRGLRWREGTTLEPGACFDEFFTFMTIRVRTLGYEPGSRWVATFIATSLPLGSRVIEAFDFEPLGPATTRVRWHVAFDPPPLLRPGFGLVAPRFEAWMQSSIESLAAYHDAQPRT